MLGFASMKRMSRGMSQREANEGRTLTVSRSSRRALSDSAAAESSSSDARTHCVRVSMSCAWLRACRRASKRS